jgi:hypothetical protein
MVERCASEEIFKSRKERKVERKQKEEADEGSREREREREREKEDMSAIGWIRKLGVGFSIRRRVYPGHRVEHSSTLAPRSSRMTRADLDK